MFAKLCSPLMLGTNPLWAWRRRVEESCWGHELESLVLDLPVHISVLIMWQLRHACLGSASRIRKNGWRTRLILTHAGLVARNGTWQFRAHATSRARKQNLHHALLPEAHLDLPTLRHA